ncbi:hypothetical protein HOD75_00890 [archaeon]|nr:hypothetical protein [archaeon]MBT4241433.1 hypothetical protein [archaeon]MBT4417696.1 hypothetical protein [archaeon]
MDDKQFMYDKDLDRLMISKKKSEDKIYGSVRILNTILDFTTDNKIVNVEIRRVSEYLKELGLNPDILDKLKEVELISKQYRDGYMIYFLLKTDNGIVEKIPFNVPMEQTIIS